MSEKKPLSGKNPPEAAIFVSRFLLPETVEALRRLAPVTYREHREPPAAEEIAAALPGHSILVCQLTDPIDAAVLRVPGLELVATAAVGYDNIDVPTAASLGIRVAHTPGVLTEATADFAWALLLAAARRVVEADRFLREGQWVHWEIDLLCGLELNGATLGLVGAGRIGQAVARRARGFGLRTIYHQRRRLDPSVESELGLEYVGLDRIWSESDVVSLHCPLTEETRGLVDDRVLGQMRPGAILVNTARGAVIDEPALARALDSGRLGAAGLDVFVDEPHVPESLLQLPNVVLAPHLGSATVATRARMGELTVDSVRRHLAGGAPLHLAPGSAP